MSVTRSPIFIVHVIHHLLIGGMENGLVNLINHLPRDQFRHAIVCVEDCSDFRQRIEREDVEVYAMHRSRIGVWRLRWRLLKLLSELKPDIVHSRNMSGLDALLPARCLGIKTIHSEHGFDVDDVRGRASKKAWLRRLHSPLVGRYVTVSCDLKRILIRESGIASRRVKQIYNGVDTDVFCPNARLGLHLLPIEWQREDLFIVGTVGRAQPIKDQATLVRAFAEVLGRGPWLQASLRLMIVGDGPALDALRQLAFDLGVEGRVWFTGARRDVSDLLQTMSLFVLPSLNEGISNTLLEAMACGLPVLATAVGGNVELLVENVVGSSFAPGDHGSLAAMICAYVKDPDRLRHHSLAARRRAVENFSLQSMVSSYQQVYESI
ncbi:MAG: TIGR03088 family PEP-CTERM/XrtA system glycosyltransferase [Betaproteobacteria bacterium]|nr:TIGR03088 family PEP-CTERM/XrtA system glycosyltransferase [Betaproteobacteria bacterium]